MNKSVSYFLLGLFVGILAASVFYSFISGGRDSLDQDARILKLAHGLDTTHPVHMGMERMKERLEELSGGRLFIEFTKRSIGVGSPMHRAIAEWRIGHDQDFHRCHGVFYPGTGDFWSALSFDDEAHFWEVLEGEVGKDLLSVGRGTGLVGLCYYDAGSRNFL